MGSAMSAGVVMVAVMTPHAIIDRAVLFVAGAGVAGGADLAVAHAGCVGIGRAAEAGVDRLIVGCAGVAFEFAFLDLVGGLERGDQFRRSLDHGIATGVRVDQAAVEMQLRAIDQAGGHALLDRTDKE